MGTSSPKESLLLSVSTRLFHLESKGICQDSPVKRFKTWVWCQKEELSTEDPPMRTNEHLSREDASLGWSSLTGAVCKSPSHLRGSQSRWGHQTHQCFSFWAAGAMHHRPCWHLHTCCWPCCFLLEAFPLTNPMHTQRLRKCWCILISPASLCLQPPGIWSLVCTAWTSSAGTA